MTAAGNIMEELETAATQLDAASTKLARLTKEFEGWAEPVVDPETGEPEIDPETEEVVMRFIEGPGTLYKIAVEAKIIEIYDEAITKEMRPPGEDVRRAKAEAHVRAQDPELYAGYQRLTTEMAALKAWISSRKQSISARQSVLKGERG